MRKASLSEVIHAAVNVVEAKIAYDLAESAGGETKRYHDNLWQCIHNLKWTIERHRPAIHARFVECEEMQPR